MIEAREVYEAWAPRDAFWSRWTKPLLFAKLKPGDLVGPGPVADLDARWAALARDIAIIVDLPGERAVAMGLGAWVYALNRRAIRADSERQRAVAHRFSRPKHRRRKRRRSPTSIRPEEQHPGESEADRRSH